MYRKIILASALAFGVSSAALAAPVEPVSSDVPAVTAAPAADQGFNYTPSIYFGGQGTVANMHYSDTAYTHAVNGINSTENTKWGGRGYLGYAFNEFIALELGYDYFGRPVLVDNVNGNTQDFLQQGVDLTGKATLPLDYGFGVYIKAGAICVWRSQVSPRGNYFVNKDANSKFTGLGGLGVTYNFVPNMAIDLSYARSLKVNDLPKMDIFALGVSYKINM